MVADHLSRLVVSDMSTRAPICDTFLDEQLFSITTYPWYVDIMNYLVMGQVPTHWTLQEKQTFYQKTHRFAYDDPYLYKFGADQIIQRCVLDSEFRGVLTSYHAGTCKDHFLAKKIATKIL